MDPIAEDVSIQNRDDRITMDDGANEPLMSGAALQHVSDAAKRRKSKKNHAIIPFVILVLMDFMIVLLLWIVYEAVSGVQYTKP